MNDRTTFKKYDYKRHKPIWCTPSKDSSFPGLQVGKAATRIKLFILYCNKFGFRIKNGRKIK